MNIVCIVTNNKLRLKTLLDNLPEERNYEIVYVTDPRVSDVIQSLNSNYHTSEEVLNEFNAEYGYVENITNYALGYKMLIPWFMSRHYNFDKLFMVDDDIIITSKLNDMMDNVITTASTSDDYIRIHDNLPLISKELRRTAFNVCGIDHNEAIKSVNGGHLLFNKNIDFNEYIVKVKTYLMSDAVTTALTNQKNWVDFFIDEIFFSCLLHQYNKQNGGAYNLNGFVNFKMFSLSNGKLKNIYATINDYAVTHFAGMQDAIVYKRLKELNYVR